MLANVKSVASVMISEWKIEKCMSIKKIELQKFWIRYGILQQETIQNKGALDISKASKSFPSSSARYANV